MKKLTQIEWEIIYNKIQEKGPGNLKDPIAVGQFLREGGFSFDIEGVDFSKTKKLINLAFHDLKFRNCNFTEVEFFGGSFFEMSAYACCFHKTSWHETAIQDSSFFGCDFSEAKIFLLKIRTSVMASCKFVLCSWNDSTLERFFVVWGDLTDAAFVNTKILNCFLGDCDLSYACWNRAVLNGVSIVRGELLGASFWDSSVQASFLIDSNLTDCLFLGVKRKFYIKGGEPNSITRPIVGLTWDFRLGGEYTSLIAKALRDNDMIPLKIEREATGIDITRLSQEVEEGIVAIQETAPKKMLSIAAELVRRCLPDSEIRKIRNNATKVIKHCDGLALPGGEDIEPEFYGAEKKTGSQKEPKYRRSIFEFALLCRAHKIKLPVMGTCRGAQMINVYFGGTLNQEVGDVHRSGDPLEVMLSESSRKEEMRALIGADTFTAISAHHQAAEKIGAGLEVVFEYAEVPKLLLTSDNMFIACQVHPEVYVITDRLNLSVQRGKFLYQIFAENVQRFSTRKV